MAALKYILILNAVVLAAWSQNEVEVREPATIVIAPAQPEHTSGGRLTLTCAAYGEPLPVITWSNPRMGVMNFSEVAEQHDSVTVNTTVIDGRFVVSFLEFCDVNYTTSSMLGGFVCEADNGVMDRPPLGQSRVTLESLSPVAQVPAVLLSSSSGNYSYLDTGLVAQCIAYGSPRPEITWSAPSLQIADFEGDEAAGIPSTVITEDAIVDGLIVTYSTLHLCPSTFNELSPYFVEIRCNTTNGLSPSLGQQMATFTPSPSIEILAFDVTIAASPNVTFTFSGSYDPSQHGCFLNKLIFVNRPASPTIRFRPQFSGRCVRQSDSGTVIVAMMDPRDYLAAYNLEFFRNSNLFVTTESSQVAQFAPPLQLVPISLEQALAVTNFVPNFLPPVVMSFDMDFINSRMLVHFNSFVIASTFAPIYFTLQGTAIDPETGQRRIHTFTSSLPTGTLENVQTVCVRLSDADVTLMTEASVCTTRDNCAAYFTPDLVDGLNGMPATDRPPTRSLPVNHFRRTLPNTESRLQMNITLTYVGCETTVVLSEDEIYIPRGGEYITRIDCFADGEMGNSFPELSYEGATISGMTLDWPLHVYYSYPGGLAGDQPGRYDCVTRSRDKISHHLVTENPYLRIIEGETATVRLYDELPLTIMFAISPPIDIRRTEIRLVNTQTSSAPSVEPRIMFVNDFKATIIFERAALSLNGMYYVQVVHDSVVRAQADLNIIVNPPQVDIFPAVATILPGQANIRLRCQASNSELPVLWVANNLVTELGSSSEYTVEIPTESSFPDLTAFTCIVRDPEINDPSPNNIVGRAVAYVRNIMDSVSISRDGTTPLPSGHVQAATSIDVTLQCLGDATGNHTNLTWIAIPDGEETQVITDDSEFFQVTYNQNEANLTVINSARLFLGKLRCYSPITGASTSVTFVEQIGEEDACPGMATDPTWGIEWDTTIAGSRDVQPCPRIDRIQTFGFASRRCGFGGEWEDSVDTTACTTALFNELQSSADNLTQTKDDIGDDELRGKLTSVFNMLNNVTTPRNQGSHFPADLNTANRVASDIISILRESIVEAIPIALNTEMIKVFNNLLNASNTEGWRQSQTRYNASSMLLDNIETYGVYLSESLTSPVVDTSQYVNGINLAELNIEYEARTGRRAVNFPATSSSFYSSSRVMITAPVLTNQMAQSVVSVVVNNIQTFLPQQMENNKTAQAVTPILSSQICDTSCSKRTFSGSDFASFVFVTTGTIGASNPRCVFWDAAQGKWSTEGVETSKINILENGEFKSYGLACSSKHLSSFAVIADVEVQELQFYTIPIYIGCGLVIFASFFALFALILSCMLDSVRKYFTVAFLTHVSFIFSVLAAYATYLVGVEMATSERASCIAVAGILHYFFTGAFAWLFCESIVITLFGWVSRRWGAFLLFLLVGWGLPAIPTAISLGLINDDYGTTSHCWFYFDGVFQTNIVLAFIIPNLIILLMIILFQVTGCFKICSLLTKKTLQGVVKKHTGRLLWCLWLSNVLFILFLSSSWVFAMLYVNVYALDSVVLGWVFMACSTALGVYIFIFSISVVLMNQKVDYDYMHQKHSGLSYVRDPMKGSTYEMLDLPIPEGPVSRPRIIIPNPVFDDAYPSAYPKTYDDFDDTKPIEVDLGDHDDEEGTKTPVSKVEFVDGGSEDGEEEEEEEESEETESDADSDSTDDEDAEGANTLID